MSQFKSNNNNESTEKNLFDYPVRILHQHMVTGKLSSSQLVEACLDRISLQGLA